MDGRALRESSVPEHTTSDPDAPRLRPDLSERPDHGCAGGAATAKPGGDEPERESEASEEGSEATETDPDDTQADPGDTQTDPEHATPVS